MLVLLGVLGLVQALFLPGRLLAEVLGLRGRLRVATASLALSLLANFGFVVLLTALHVFRGGVLGVIVAAEVATWFALRRASGTRVDGGAPPARAASIEGAPPPARTATVDRAATPAPVTFTATEALAALAALLLALWYAGRVVRAASGVFSGEDDVASWNRWALDWARGLFPRHTWHYPQILPVAWAIGYRMTGSEVVQAFARGMMPVFGLATMAVLLDHARGARRLAFLFAAWLAGLFLARVNNVTAGLADLPVAFLATLALTETLRPVAACDVGGPPARLAWIHGAAAALTKQAGLGVAVVVPLLEAWRLAPGARTRAALVDLGRTAILVLPWYAAKQIQIALGLESSEVAHVLGGAHHGVALAARPGLALAQLAHVAGGWPVLVAVLLLAALGLRDPLVRPIVLGYALPFTLVWLFGFSYDPRNLSAALPAWAIACASGLAALLARIPSPRFVLPAFQVRRPPRAVSFAALALALIVLGFAVPDRALVAHARRLELGLGDRATNLALIDLRARDRRGTKVVVDPRWLLAYAPGWDSTLVTAPLDDPRAFAAAVARPDAGWLVLRRDAPAGLLDLMRIWKRQGAWRLAQTTAVAEIWERRFTIPGATRRD